MWIKVNVAKGAKPNGDIVALPIATNVLCCVAMDVGSGVFRVAARAESKTTIRYWVKSNESTYFSTGGELQMLVIGKD